MIEPRSRDDILRRAAGANLGLIIASVAATWLSVSVFQANSSGGDSDSVTHEQLGTVALQSIFVSMLVLALTVSARWLMHRRKPYGFGISALAWLLCLVHPWLWFAVQKSPWWGLTAAVILWGAWIQISALRVAGSAAADKAPAHGG